MHITEAGSKDNRPAVLLVEDEAWMRDMLSAYLRAHGYRVICGADGRQALALFHHFVDRLSIVISDVEMPVMSGLELANAIRETRVGFPVLLMSGKPLPPSAEGRGWYYLAKPFNPQTFLEIVDRLVRLPAVIDGIVSNLDGTQAHERLRVVVADDQKETRQSLVAALRRSHEVVGVFVDGPSLLEGVHSLHPDLILLDISMPGMNGFEVARKLRDSGSDAPVVFVSQHEGRPYIEEALRSGAAGYVLKRTLAQELEPAVEQVHAGQKYVSPCLRRSHRRWKSRTSEDASGPRKRSSAGDPQAQTG